MPKHLASLGVGRAANILAYTNKVIALAPIAYWPLADASGATATDESGNGRNGTYTSVTLGATGIGDGRTAATFVAASSSLVNVYTAGLAGAFNGAEGTMAAWAQVSGSGVWTDGSVRRVMILQASATNVIRIGRIGSNNVITIQYVANNVSKSVNHTASGQTTWLHFAITWSASNNRMRAYVNGAQTGANQTGLGVWAGSLASTGAVLGTDSTTPAFLWSGNIAHAAVFASELTPAQILSLATVP